jgi:hypothetical protein
VPVPDSLPNIALSAYYGKNCMAEVPLGPLAVARPQNPIMPSRQKIGGGLFVDVGDSAFQEQASVK